VPPRYATVVALIKLLHLFAITCWVVFEWYIIVMSGSQLPFDLKRESDRTEYASDTHIVTIVMLYLCTMTFVSEQPTLSERI
jgi:hypothetical protein